MAEPITSAAEEAKRGLIRRGIDGVKSIASTGADMAGKGYDLGGRTLKAAVTPTGAGVLSAGFEGYNQVQDYNRLAATPGTTQQQLSNKAIEGGAATLGRGVVTGLGAAAGGTLGLLAPIPGGSYAGAVAGGALANSVFDNTRDRLAATGRNLRDGKFGNAAEAFFGVPGSYEDSGKGVINSVLPSQAPQQAGDRRVPFDQLPQATYSNEGKNYPRGSQPREFYPGQTAGDKQLADDLKNPWSNASVQKRNPGGQVMKVVNPDGSVSYSGGNVTGDVSFTDKDGKALPGQARGGFIGGNGDGTFRYASPREMAAMYAAGGPAAVQRQNALMAANLRDGVDPYRGFNGPQVSIMPDRVGNMTGSGGGSGNRAAQSAKEILKELGSASRNISQATLRQLIQSDTSLVTNAATNETSRLNNRDTNDTSRLNNRDTNETSRLNNHDTNATHLEAAGIPKKLELAAVREQRGRLAAYMEASTPRGKDGKPAGEPDHIAAHALALRHGDKEGAALIAAGIEAQQKIGKSKVEGNKAIAEETDRDIVIPLKGKDGEDTGKRDTAAEAAVGQYIRANYKNFDTLDKKEKAALVQKAHAEHKVIQRINNALREQSGVQVDGFGLTFNGHRPQFSGAPNLRGATVETVGAINGYKRGSGDTLLTGMNGGNYGALNLSLAGDGPLSIDELEALKRFDAK